MKNTTVNITISVKTADGCSFDTKKIFSTERSLGGDLSLKQIRQSGIKQVRDALAEFKERIEELEADEAVEAVEADDF